MFDVESAAIASRGFHNKQDAGLTPKAAEGVFNFGFGCPVLVLPVQLIAKTFCRSRKKHLKHFTQQTARRVV